MRLFYTLLFHLLLPLVLLRLYWRGFKAPEYRKRWKQRLAIYSQKYASNVIWIHAVSVGEAEAVFPLIKRLQEIYPAHPFLVTTTTPTGSARVQAVLSDTVSHVYFPYDLPSVVSRFLKVFRPKIGIIMEKEIWPNHYAGCADQKIPLMIINARLSANSAKGYKKIPGLVKPALENVSWVLTQTEEDQQRFIQIGAIEGKTRSVGNLKFDLECGDEIKQQAKKVKQQLFPQRFVWLIASTHEQEEKIFLQLYPQLKKHIPDLLLIIVPRHPERFSVVKKLTEKMGLKVCMRSTGQSITSKTDVYIADTMGELRLLYGTADICFVAGSMTPVGGHNILEPAAMGVPILFGPHMTNFKEIANNVLDLKAAIQCADKDDICQAVLLLYNDIDYRKKMTDQALRFLSANQGASDKIIVAVSEVLLTQQ